MKKKSKKTVTKRKRAIRIVRQEPIFKVEEPVSLYEEMPLTEPVKKTLPGWWKWVCSGFKFKN